MPGMATGYSKALGLLPSQDLPQRVEEETDHLLGLPGRQHQTGELGTWEKGGIVTDNLLGAPKKGATVKETWGLRKREAL